MIFDGLISAEHKRQLTNLGALRGAVNALTKAKEGCWDKYSYYCDKRSASLRAGDDEMYKLYDKISNEFYEEHQQMQDTIDATFSDPSRFNVPL